MRRNLGVLVALTLVLGAGLPDPALAKRVTAFGSLRLSRCTNPACTTTEPLVDQVVVSAVTANPGLEKTITVFVQAPPFALPVFVNSEKGNPGNGDLDTLIVMTDVTGGGLTVSLALYDQNGALVSLIPNTVVIPANGTAAVSLANLLQ